VLLYGYGLLLAATIPSIAQHPIPSVEMGVVMPLKNGVVTALWGATGKREKRMEHQSPQRHYIYLAMIFLNHSDE
jgi:hypothetical protein